MELFGIWKCKVCLKEWPDHVKICPVCKTTREREKEKIKDIESLVGDLSDIKVKR